MGARTELGRALETLAATQTREKRLGANAKASILYDARDAADVDRETIHAIAVRGFEELCRRDGRFEGFVKTLFSRARAEAGHRESEDAETSRATSVEIRRYLRLLSGYFTEKCAISTLEYLVRRFKIHVYDVDDFIACALPWHSTAEFVKCAQTCQLENSKHFKWLSGVKETGAAPPRDALAVRCSKDKAFFSFCAERATEMATAKGNVGVTSAFYAVLITEAVGVMKDVDGGITTRLLPYLEAGLASAANSEQFAGALMVATQLAARTNMAEPLVEALLEGIAKGTRVPLHSQSLQAMLALCQTQRVKTLPERAFKHLVKIPELEELVAELAHTYRADAFTIPFTRSLAEFADVHANYERVFRAVVEKVPLRGKHFIAAVPILLKTAKKGDTAAEMVKSLLTHADQHRPVATSEAVDFVFRGSSMKKSTPEKANKKDKMVASEEDAAFLRAALLGSASAPMRGHATSIHAALDHPNASLRENALAQLARLAADAGDEEPTAIRRGSALGPAVLRRVTDDDARVAAAAMDLEPLRRVVNDDGALFAAAKQRLAIAATALASGSEHSENERRVAKKALRLILATLSKTEDGTAPSPLASRCAATALEHVLFSSTPTSRAVTKAALNAARVCPHASLDGVRSNALRDVVGDGKSIKDVDARRAFEDECNAVVLRALAESLLSDAWTEDRRLWMRETYRDATNVGRVTLLTACALAVERTASGKPKPKASPDAVGAIRDAAWSLIRDSWTDDGVASTRGVDRDDDFPAGSPPRADAVRRFASSDAAARKYAPSCHRALLRATLASASKTSASVSEDARLRECFVSLATTETTDDALDAIIGDFFGRVLDACERRRGADGARAFLASLFSADPRAVDARAQVAALELAVARATDVPLASVVVAVASSSSRVRSAAATALARCGRDATASAFSKHLAKSADQVSRIGAGALCDAITRGLQVSSAPSKELSMFLEPVVAMTTGGDGDGDACLDAYGARCLLAATRDATLDDVSVANTVAVPTLVWCLDAATRGDGDGDDTHAELALAVEALRAFTPAYAATWGPDGGEGWTTLARCAVAPSPPAARAAAFAQMTPEFVSALAPAARAAALKVLFAAVNADADETSRREARRAANALTLDAADVAKTIDAAVVAAAVATPASSKKRAKTTTNAAKTSTSTVTAAVSLGSARATRDAATALETLAWKLNETTNPVALAAPCLRFLEALLNHAEARRRRRDAQNASDDDSSSDDDSDEDDESGVAAGGYLEALVLRALESLAALGVHPRDGWNVPLVVRAVREVDEGAARSAALACLAQIAKTAPDAVRDDVFDVGAALSDRAAAAADDVLSQRALESALVAVVPVWLEGGEPLVNVVSRLIDSLPRAPARRRAPVCAALVRAAPEGEALPAVVVTLLRRLKSLEAEARDRRTATEAVVDAEDAPVAAEEDAWVKELLDALLARETPMAATAALVAALKESAKEGGRIVRACAESVARHLSSPQFIRAQSRVVDEDEQDALQRAYGELAESAIVLLKSVSSKDVTPSGKSKSPGKSPAKLAAKTEASGESLLAALNGLLASGPFLRALTPLLDHKEGRVRRKALALVTERLQNASAEDDVEDVAETAAGVALIDELSTLVKSKNATTSQAALIALEAAALRFSGAADAVKPMLTVVPAVIAQLDAPAITLRASAALSLASLAKILGARMVSVINVAVPALLKTTLASADALHDDNDTVAEFILVAHSCLAALRVFLNNVAGFVSPFLSDIIKVVLHPAMIPPCGDESDARGDARGLHDLAMEIRRELPVLLELRLVVRPLVESWDSCLEHAGDDGAASCSALLDILAAAGDSDKATNAYRQQLFSVVLRALDIRRSAPMGASEESLDVVEGKAVDACVALAHKCTESEFLPFFLQCVEWARARSGEADVTRTRLAALFRLAASLADELRAVFVPFFRHLLDLAAAALDVGADPSSGKKKRRSAGSEGLSASDIWRMRRWTLAALRRCFQYDNVGFLDSNRYNMLYPLVVEQLKAKPPRSDSDEDDYDSFAIEGSFGYEVVGACASLLAAAPDDAHWKPLHRAILMCGRDNKIRTRALTVKTMELVVDKLQEEYLVLLPEAIPFLAELTEDIEPEIERMTRKLTKRLSELSGEDLKTLMTDGFTPKAKKTPDDSDDDDDESE